jgi:aminoglycoside phosphotransferase (APT) family kinase protein
MKTREEQIAWEARDRGLAANLLRVLERQTGAAGLAYAAQPAPLVGGLWAALYRFRLERAPEALSGELVLRIVPADDERFRHEAHTQAAVAAAGFPAPRVRLSGGRELGLGGPFIIMDRAAGGTLVSGLGFGARLRAAWHMPELLAGTMARLHAVDPARLEGAATNTLDSVLADVDDKVAPLELPAFRAAAAWLRGHRPPERRRVVCHGDIHPLNLMLEDGQVSALLDWTAALLTDPAFDVAYTAQILALWPLDVPRLPRPALKGFGRYGAARFLRAYRRQAPDPGNLTWYEALHSLRLLTRVARARLGITLPPLAGNHPWELVVPDACAIFQQRAGIALALPPR